MKKNMSTFDRVARVIAAIVFALLIYSGAVEGTLAIVMGIVAALLLLTGFVSFCPLYSLLKFSTRKTS